VAVGGDGEYVCERWEQKILDTRASDTEISPCCCLSCTYDFFAGLLLFKCVISFSVLLWILTHWISL
jgi:hypothetical protein